MFITDARAHGQSIKLSVRRNKSQPLALTLRDHTSFADDFELGLGVDSSCFQQLKEGVKSSNAVTVNASQVSSNQHVSSNVGIIFRNTIPHKDIEAELAKAVGWKRLGLKNRSALV